MYLPCFFAPFAFSVATLASLENPPYSILSSNYSVEPIDSLVVITLPTFITTCGLIIGINNLNFSSWSFYSL